VADDKLGGRRLAGATVKEYENRLKTEMDDGDCTSSD